MIIMRMKFKGSDYDVDIVYDQLLVDIKTVSLSELCKN